METKVEPVGGVVSGSMLATASTLVMDVHTVRYMSINIVDCSDIRSQWQAHFSQRFPVETDKLPAYHESDKAFFERNWKGGQIIDAPGTYENFMLWTDPAHAPKLLVYKPSGKPFKSGAKKAVATKLIEVEVPSAHKNGVRTMKKAAAYEFAAEGEGYWVRVCQCRPVEETP